MATSKRPALRKHDRVTLAAHKSVIPPYDGKPFVLRDTVLTVSHLTGTGSNRNPWHVVVTDGTHFWHLEPDDVARVENDAGGASHHATKKSPAQLDREIAEVLAGAGSSSPFEEAKAEGALLEKEVASAGEALKAFPRGAMGLTPDAVASTPEYRAAKTRFQKAFARLRAFNAVFTKRFAKELRAERANRYGRR